eukprot:220253-Prorocentrum_lima.AAC.1
MRLVMEQQYSKITLFFSSLRKGPFSAFLTAATLPPGELPAMPVTTPEGSVEIAVAILPPGTVSSSSEGFNGFFAAFAGSWKGR